MLWWEFNAGIDFLEFRPSEIAAAVAISVSGEIKAVVDIDRAISSFIHVEKVKKKNGGPQSREKK